MQQGHGSTFLRRIQLRNFRSIAACDVELGPLTFLVGINGAGKSNFLDALRLVGDALKKTLDHALRERGGIQEVRRRSGGHPTSFGIRLDFVLPVGHSGSYSFEVSAGPNGDYFVKKEACRIGLAHYEVEKGVVTRSSSPVSPPASADRLYLTNAAGLPDFRPLFDALVQMGFYNIDPAQIRGLQAPDPGELLARDGRNLASVAARMERMDPEARTRIEEYLARVVPGLVGFDKKSVGHMETLEFRQAVEGARDPWRFPAINMSDGTLRVTALLLALFQRTAGDGGVRLVGIEEPETALHPAAAGLLRDCIFEASRNVQVVVTSHSADLLDDPDVSSDSILAVESRDGSTMIAPVDSAAREVLREQLYTVGELLRLDQLRPDLARVPSLRQLRLFGEID